VQYLSSQINSVGALSSLSIKTNTLLFVPATTLTFITEENSFFALQSEIHFHKKGSLL
jgi:hypothetical protein